MALELSYQKVLTEESIDPKTLPIEIREKIRILKPLIQRYNNAIDEDKPSESLKDAVVKQDIEIADMIADFMEKDLPTEAELQRQQEEEKQKAEEALKLKNSTKNEPTPEEKEEAKKKLEEKKAQEEADKKKAQEEADEKAKKDAVLAQESEVMAIINSRSDKRIPASDLQKIIGAEPSNPQVVGSKKFKTVYLNSSYYEEI